MSRFKPRRKTEREGLFRDRQWGCVFSTWRFVIMSSEACCPLCRFHVMSGKYTPAICPGTHTVRLLNHVLRQPTFFFASLLSAVTVNNIFLGLFWLELGWPKCEEKWAVIVCSWFNAVSKSRQTCKRWKLSGYGFNQYKNYSQITSFTC